VKYSIILVATSRWSLRGMASTPRISIKATHAAEVVTSEKRLIARR
jgi:hypothetical protein